MLYLGAKKSLLSSGKTLAQQVAAIFAGGEQGAWYDPSDLSTLFQDSAGSIPVTNTAQQVGLMLDKSGRGKHAVQATTINRPIFQQDGNGKLHLAFNGTNSWMSTPAIDFTATDKMTVVAGVRKLSDALAGMLLEQSVNSVTNNGTFALLAPGGSNSSITGYLRGDTATSVSSPLGYVAPMSYVQTLLLNIAGAAGSTELVHRINSAGVVGGGASAGGGNFGSYPLYIGARGGSAFFANMNFYGLIVRGTLSSDPQIASAERFMNSKTGAY